MGLACLAASLTLFLSNLCFAQSPDGTAIPPASNISILISRTDVWSLGPPNTVAPGNYFVQRNGVGVLSASGSKLLLCAGQIHVLGRLGSWWIFNGVWIDLHTTVQPCGIKTFSLSWTADYPVELLPVTINVYRDNTKVGNVLYPIAVYSDTVTGQSKAQVCYEVTAQNTAGESPKSNTACGVMP